MTDAAGLSVDDLWRQALATTWHGAGCTCHGGGTPVKLSAAELESDLIEYLLPRYEKAGARELVSALNTRQTTMASAPFLSWLKSDAVGALPAPAREALLADMRHSLQSFVEQNASAHHHH